jgi:hypothetical protein
MNHKLMTVLLSTALLAGAMASSFAAESGAPAVSPLPGAAGSTPGAGRPGPTVPNAGTNSLPSTTGSAARGTTANPPTIAPDCASRKAGAGGVNPNC